MSVKLKEPENFKKLLALNGYSVDGFAKKLAVFITHLIAIQKARV